MKRAFDLAHAEVTIRQLANTKVHSLSRGSGINLCEIHAGSMTVQNTILDPADIQQLIKI